MLNYSWWDPKKKETVNMLTSDKLDELMQPRINGVLSCATEYDRGLILHDNLGTNPFSDLEELEAELALKKSLE